ncbi:MAG: hypothetical protein FJ387_14090 [Verrucomicrobia bacterium]|nr:hypothetical protein [Verrucomicrobiota bacterium]
MASNSAADASGNGNDSGVVPADQTKIENVTLILTSNSGFQNNGLIPDNNVNGWSDTRTLSSISDNLITDVNVTLNISGAEEVAFNGDLYGYLVHSSGFAVLLNRVGRSAGNLDGFGDDGLNLTQCHLPGRAWRPGVEDFGELRCGTGGAGDLGDQRRAAGPDQRLLPA